MTFDCESVSRWRIPSSPYSTDIESRIAPSFHTAMNAAAVSGVGGSSMATRSPRPTPCAASTFASRPALSWISPQLTSRTVPAESSWIMASFSRGCLSHTSVAML